MGTTEKREILKVDRVSIHTQVSQFVDAMKELVSDDFQHVIDTFNQEQGEQADGQDGVRFTPPDKEEAKKHRTLWLFKDFERDGNGLPMGEGYPFHLFAGSRDIGLESEGLGLYFQSMVLFCYLFFGLMLLAIPPLVDNLEHTHFSLDYQLTIIGDPQSVANASVTCPKYWASSVSFASNSSIGAFCPDNEYSNPFDCPAVCDWDVAQAARNGVCDGIDFSNTECEDHSPCSNGALRIAQEDPLATNGICMCCDLQLNTEETGSTSIWQIYLYLFGVFVFMCGSEILQGLSDVYAYQINNSQTTAADYSVLVSELGFKDEVSDEDLKKFCRHYGEVVHVARIKKVGEIVSKSRLLTDLELKQYEIKAQIQNPCEVPQCCGFFSWMFRKLYAGNTPEDLENVNKRLQKLRQEIDLLDNKELENTDRAIIIFNYNDHQENMINDFKRTFYQEVKRNLTVGRIDDAPKLKNRTLIVRRAPEPTDLWWQHTHYVGHLGRNRRITSISILCFALIVAIVVQGYFTGLSADERQKRMQMIASGQQIDFTENARLQAISITSGLVVTFINMGVSYLISFLTSYEMWPTRSQHEKWHVLKLSVFYILNSAVVPALVPIINDRLRDEDQYSRSTESFYSSGGVINSALYIQISNAIVPDLLTLFNPTYILFKKILPRFAATQEMLNSMVKPPEFALSERFSSALKTIGLALFYGPALPISYVLALFGLAFSYWTDKYVALRRCKKPLSLSVEVDDTILFLLKLLPIMQVLMMGLVYFAHTGVHRILILVLGLGMWVVFQFTNFSHYIGLRGMRGGEDSAGTRDQPFLKTLGTQGELIEHDQDDVELSVAQSSAIINNYNRKKAKKNVRIVLVRRFMYKPRVRNADEMFRRKLADLYDLPNEAAPAITTLLPGQKETTGKFYALPPKQEHDALHAQSPTVLNLFGEQGSGQGQAQVHPVIQHLKSKDMFKMNRYPTFSQHTSINKFSQSFSPFLPMVLYRQEQTTNVPVQAQEEILGVQVPGPNQDNDAAKYPQL